MSSQRKIKSIKGYQSFSNLFKIAHKKRNNKLLTAYTYNENNPKYLFLGVSVPKKIIKKSVCRNRVKRLLRESIRQINKENVELLENIEQLILIWQNGLDKPSQIKLQDVKEEVKDILSKALIRKNEIHTNINN